VKWLFAPATALMNRLKYPQKFAVISLVFAVPLTLVTYFWVAEIDERIEFAQKEVHGTAYLRPLRSLLEHVPQHGMLAHGLRAGWVAVRRGDVLAKQREIDGDFERLAAADQRLGGVLGTTARLEAVRANWQDLEAKLPALTVQDSDVLHRKLVADIRALTSHVGDTSNLILDPDLDSYYLMDAVLLKLPERQDLLARIRLIGADVVSRRAATAEERSQLTVLGGLVRANVEATRAGMATALRTTASGRLRRMLEPAVDRAGDATERSTRASRSGTTRRRGSTTCSARGSTASWAASASSRRSPAGCCCCWSTSGWRSTSP